MNAAVHSRSFNQTLRKPDLASLCGAGPVFFFKFLASRADFKALNFYCEIFYAPRAILYP